MNKKLLFLRLLVGFLSFHSFGQNNPVENLTWWHDYEFPRNFFELRWEEPAQPHDELIGYNIYRNNELYRFQTETSIYNYWTPLFGIVTNCGGESFLGADNQGQWYDAGVEMHVTAVYNSPQVESDYVQSYFDEGLLLQAKAFTASKAGLYPNPTNGIVNIESGGVQKIVVYDLSGKSVAEFAAQSQIDLGHLSKGMYILKLFSNSAVRVEKVVVQ